MKTIIITITEDEKRDAVAATMEINPEEVATELEVVAAKQIAKCFHFLIAQGLFLPKPLGLGYGPLADLESEIQFDIAKAGKRK